MKVIVVSHGSYARGLVDTVQMIAGEQEDLEAFGLEPEEICKELLKAAPDTVRDVRELYKEVKE